MGRRVSPAGVSVVRTGLACLVGAMQVVGGSAHAQGQAQNGHAASANDESGKSLSMGDIVVTAQRREERLINVPVVVSAVSGAAIQELGINQAAQLSNFVPSLEIVDAGTIPKVALRGVALNDFGYSNESPIAFYANDVYFASPLSPLGQMFDVNRVEVLRGPQGTLFGRNATGGLIQIITNKPKADFSGSASIRYGSYNQVIVEGYQNIPLSASIRTRTAAIFNRDDGWQRSVVNGVRFAKTNTWGVRETVDVDLGPSITNSIMGHYGKSRGQGILSAFRGTLDPVTGAVCSPTRIIANECVTSTGLRNLNPNPRDVYTSLTKAPNFSETWGVDNTLKYSGSGFNLTSVTAYESISASYSGDVPTIPNNFYLDSYGSSRKQFSQEIRADGEFDQFKWVAGVYYFHDKMPFAFISSPPLIAILHTTIGLQNQYRQTTDSAAGFGQIDYSILPSVTVTGGIRYSWEKRTLTISDDFSNPIFIDTYSPTSKVVTWKAGAKWQVQDGLMVYANVATGFKTAAFNTSLVGPGQATPAKPEKNTNYEIGLKGETADRRLQGSIVAFYTDYREIQTITIPPGSLSTRLYNLPKAEIKGVEAEFAARPIGGLSLDGSISILDTKIIAPGVLIAGIPVDGQRLGMTPKLSVKGGVRYDFETASLGTISPWLHASYRSKSWGGSPMKDLDMIPGYALLDAGLSWTSPDRKWGVDFLVQNATDTAYYTNGNDLLGFDTVKFGEVKRYSVKVSTSW